MKYPGHEKPSKHDPEKTNMVDHLITKACIKEMCLLLSVLYTGLIISRGQRVGPGHPRVDLDKYTCQPNAVRICRDQHAG